MMHPWVVIETDWMMSFLASTRGKRGAARRRVLGVFVAMWVSLGLQPCAVAAVSDVECPHCPPEHEHAMAAAHDHGHSNTESSGRGTQSACCEADDAAIDTRWGKIEDKDAGDFSAAIPASEPAISLRHDAYSGSAVDPPDRGRSSIRLHVLYCVYLD